jgi:hypothetical protein
MKSIPLALAAIATAAAFAATPVLAGDSKGFDADRYVTLLHYAGINAIDAEDYWNGTLKATIRLDDGTTAFRFFDKDSLQPVAYAFGR